MKNFGKVHEKPESKNLQDSGTGEVYSLVLHNDDIHTFEYVIESLIEVCNHDTEQAEQCTYLVHYKGKCDIKRGSYDYLLPYKKGLSRRGLIVTINS
ncbi:MAG: ATP-dependent Clp protease adaptor ClpS [Bacteroidales bacterium]|nr:ATP-dependent Clp protease adaptor ClpS [Bacteroidales bacterium]HOK99276.1 ATP-dependent Clp protease adaptor ClpS [Bacteroidales bacterium]HPO66174.1 ATP-dependent Clp protease adaptor ClpS [Bacteroidales bacterium]